MKLKYALWATAVWTVLALGSCAVMVGYIVTHPIPGVSGDRRANLLGQGAATVMVIGYGAIWLPFIYQVGKRRREAQQAQRNQERKTKTRRSPNP
jgi:type II secretory pathway component PulM